MDMNGYKTGVIGKNLTHSYSPMLHNLLGDMNYAIYDLAEKDLKQFIEKRDYKGLNVTIPYKTKVIEYIDEIEKKAEIIGSINTIVNDGLLKGYNTDYDGFLYMCKDKVKNKVCAVLGNGGVSLAVIAVLKDEMSKKIYVVSRNKKERTIDYNDLYLKQDEIEVIINTTPVGMYPHMLEQIIDLKKFKNLKYVFDLIYNPINTMLVQEARTLNIEASSGLDMLIKQAIVADELIFKRKHSITVKQISKIIRDKQMNIVLIGLPGAGKSVVGEMLSKALNKNFIDLDIEIVKKTNKTINEIFKIDNGKTFRAIEQDIVKEVSLLHNTIIATGGGVVLNDDNMRLLKANGIIICLQRDLDKIVIDNNRPLLKSKQDLLNLYLQRKELYDKYQDIIISNNGLLEDTINDIIKKI